MSLFGDNRLTDSQSPIHSTPSYVFHLARRGNSPPVRVTTVLTREVMIVKTLIELQKKGVSRRNFLAGASAVGAASVLAGCSNNATTTTPTPPVTATPPPTYVDADYLNFALNLEYLEANFFLYAATGAGLATADMGSSPGAVTVPMTTATASTPAVANTKIPGLTSLQQDIINEIAYAEQQHVRFLRAALGSSAVAMPAIDLMNSFNSLATAAGIGASFNPFASFDDFLVGAFIFEDVGVTAYSGAAPLLTSSSNLNYAAGIQAVEAYHAAYVRTTLTANAITTPGYLPFTYANQVSALRATLGGGNETPLTLPTSTATPSSIVPASATTAVAYARTTDQVLHIVYGTLTNTVGSTSSGAGVAAGGFFPSGLNGNIKVTFS